ncbi:MULTISPECIES: DUF547 domain-containing protein [Aphanothece]|uniref:DUF547 domain-containing protein n=1 Tax=Aphanothece TaxID=1121 RepID=UPI0039851CC6
MNPPTLRHLPALGLGLLLLSGCGLAPNRLAGSPPSATPPAALPAAPPARATPTPPLEHQALARVLKRVVDRDGLVDYRRLQRDPGDLETYLAELGAVPAASFAAWDETEQIAFLINAYNALTLASIIRQEPIRPSIRDIWGVWNLTRHRVAGEAVTLDHIEHGILRRRYDEPRIHAALVCAAISCPPLRQEPFRGASLEHQLEDQSRRWLRSRHGLQIDRAAGTVGISAIFQWFGDDWKRRYATDHGFGRHRDRRAVLNFISGYVSAADRDLLRRGDYRLSVLEYDWSLNSQPDGS